MATKVIATGKIWLSQPEAEEYLGKSRKFFTELIKADLLPSYKVSHSIFFLKEDIDSLIKNNKQ